MTQTKLVYDILADSERLCEVGEAIKSGKTVVFPTETVYGLGANGLDERAIDGIYQAKGRPSDNPLILHVSSLAMLEVLVSAVSNDAKQLIAAFWPGPLTLVFHKRPSVPFKATGGLNTVAVRMPRHPIARAVIESAGVPIAAPSANLSGKPSPTRADHVIEDLDGRVDYIICDDSVDIGLESTVVDMTTEVPCVLRPGSISLAQIEGVLGRAVRVSHAEAGVGDFVPVSPGMKYTHYAPESPLILLEGSALSVEAYIREYFLSEGRIGYLLFEDTLKLLGLSGRSLGNRQDLDGIASRLFQNLRHFKAVNYDKIVCEIPAETHGVGEAIRNRLLKASGQRPIKL